MSALNIDLKATKNGVTADDGTDYGVTVSGRSTYGEASQAPEAPVALVPPAPELPPTAHVPVSPLTSARISEHDEITRGRDVHGNRLGTSAWFSIPTTRAIDLEHSHIEKAIQVIEDAGYPGRAYGLRAFFAEKLQRAVERLREVQDEEHTRLNALNVRAAAQNEEIARDQARLTVLRDKAAEAHVAALRALDEPLADAHHEAAEACSVAGGTYDPDNPSEQCVLRLQSLSTEAEAGGMGLPWTPTDSHTHLSRWLYSALTALIGIMLGMSIGLMAGVFTPGDMSRRPMMLVLFGLIGIAAAVAGGAAIKHSQKYAAERYYLGHHWISWAPFTFLAIAVDAVVLLIDAQVERAGLLKVATLKQLTLALGGHSQATDSQWIYLLCGVLITFGYVVYMAWEGFAYGRKQVVPNRLAHRRETEMKSSEESRRALPEVKQALHRIARVNELRRQAALHMGRIEETVAPFNDKIATLEGQRLRMQEELDEQGRQRIQDALDNLHGAQAIFDAMLANALAEVEPSARVLSRFRWLFGGYHEPRHQLKKRRGKR